MTSSSALPGTRVALRASPFGAGLPAPHFRFAKASGDEPAWPACHRINPLADGDETILGNPRNRPETNGRYTFLQQRGGKDAWRLP